MFDQTFTSYGLSGRMSIHQNVPPLWGDMKKLRENNYFVQNKNNKVFVNDIM